MYTSYYTGAYNWIIAFDVIVGITLVLRLIKTKGFGHNETWILNLLLAGILCSVSDVVCVSAPEGTNGLLFYIINCIFYLSFVASSFLIFNHTLDLLGVDSRKNKGFVFVKLIPFILVLAGNVVSYFNHSIFYMDAQDNYHRGPLYSVFYVVCCLYAFATLAVALYGLVKRKSRIPVHPAVFSVPLIAGTCLQTLLPSIPFSNMGLTLTFLLIFMNNQEMIINRYRDAVQEELEDKQRILEDMNRELKSQFEQIDILQEELQKNQENDIRDFLDLVVKSEKENLSVDELVKAVGLHFDADRAYIFEQDPTASYTVNTYEWCRQGVNPEIQNLQEVPLSVIDPWIVEFKKKGVFFINCDDEYSKKEPIVYEILEPQGIDSLMAAPITKFGKIIGFLGVDNPHAHTEQELLLSVAASVINQEIYQSREKEKEQVYREELEFAKKAAEAANEAKTVFLNNMSHDIRTPMNAILGFANLMKKDTSDRAAVEDYLKKIEESGRYLLTVINNVLDMARIESGKMELDENFSDILSEDNNVVNLLDAEIEKKEIKLTCNTEIEHRYVLMDLAKTMQITMNLLSNAVKYTPRGGKIDINYRELPCEREGYGRYEMTIKDNGIGMSKEFQEHLFDSFTRERNTTESKVIGTGLGMAIVKRLVDLMDGTISVDSELGKGTTFVFTLEYKLVENPESYINHNTGTNEVDLKGLRILLAEDNDLNAEIAQAVLEDLGIIVERAIDGVDCLKMLAESDYDAILMDIQMPNMDGYAATEKIRKHEDSKKSSIPILAMTANAFESDRQAALKSGMNEHIAKPINVEDLVRKLSAAVKG